MAHFLTRLVVSSSLCAAVSVASAADLLDVYKQALSSDPTFKQAHSQWLVDKESFPLALTGDGTAGTGLFPNISMTGTLKSTNTKLNYPTVTDTNTNKKTEEYELSATQPVFNAATWSTIATSRYTVRAATATYLSSGQSLISRTLNAYMEVLRNYEILQYDLAAQAALYDILKVAKHKYHVGLKASTDVYSAQASYDLQKVVVIKQRNTLRIAQEDLRAITGQDYASLQGLPKDIPLVIPNPQRMESWVKIAESQNYALLADLLTMQADKGAIRTKQLSHLPTVNAVANYDYLNHDTASQSGSEVPSNKTAYIGLSVNFPVFQGGYLYASTKQARYTYLKASDAAELQHRTVIRDTRDDYLGVTSGISQVHADWASVLSSRADLQSTLASYNVGSSSITDLLTSANTLFSAFSTWVGDRYDYIESLVQLKYDAGTLSPKDIVAINAWLHRPVALGQDRYRAIFKEMLRFNVDGLIKSAKKEKKVKVPVVAEDVAQPVDAVAADALIESVKQTEANVPEQVADGHMQQAQPAQEEKGDDQLTSPQDSSQIEALPTPSD